MKKYGCQYCSAKWVLHNLNKFKNTEYLQYLPQIPWEPEKQTKHYNDYLQRAS